MSALRLLPAIALAALAAGSASCSLLIDFDRHLRCPVGGCDGGPSGAGDGAPLDGRFGDASIAPSPDAGEDGSTPDGGACDAQIYDDPANCGRCGHDCRPGACTMGRCTETPIATAMLSHNMQGLIADSTNVYWSTTGTLMNQFTDGTIWRFDGRTTTMIASGLQTPYRLAFDADNVYWTSRRAATDGGGVYTCPRAGCGASTPRTVLPDLHYALDIAIHGNLLFVTTNGSGALFRCTLPACSDPISLFEGQDSTLGLALDVDRAYAANEGSSGATGSIVSCPQTGPCLPLMVLASLLDGPHEVAVYAGQIYWVESSGKVSRCPRDGCGGPPTEMATGPDTAQSIAVDDSGIYWTIRGNPPTYPEGQVLMCPLAGCMGRAPIVVADHQPYAVKIVLTSTVIYWITNTHVVRLAK
jgi:hypothetical protein